MEEIYVEAGCIRMDKRERLFRCLFRFFRWQFEGRPEYGHGEGQQTYYSPYYREIEPLGDNVFRFRIQVHDAPQGDLWWYGKCRLKGGIGIRIIEEDHEKM